MKLAYIGCRTTRERNARGKGIKVFEIGSDGEWKLTQLVEGVVNPSFLCTDRTEQFLYTVHGDGSMVSAYRIGLDGPFGCGPLQPLAVSCEPSVGNDSRPSYGGRRPSR